MAVPKRKTSPSRRNMRRSHDAIKGLNIMFNPDSGEAMVGHRMCKDGMYRGRKVVAEKEVESQEENKQN